MCGKLSFLGWIAAILLIIGGLNWGLIGVFNFDLVAVLLGHMTGWARLVYILVGLAAVYMIFFGLTGRRKSPL